MSRTFVLSVFLVFFIGLVSCRIRIGSFGGQNSNPNSWNIGSVYGFGSNLVTVDQSITHVNLKSGDTLDLALVENPSTGYRWIEQGFSRNGVLVSYQTSSQGLSNHHVSNPHSSGMVGAPGVSHFYYRAVASGVTSLRLVNKRWHEAEFSDVYELNVSVS